MLHAPNHSPDPLLAAAHQQSDAPSRFQIYCYRRLKDTEPRGADTVAWRGVAWRGSKVHVSQRG